MNNLISFNLLKTSKYFNNLPRTTRLIAHTSELFHQKAELVRIIKMLENNTKKQVQELQKKIERIDDDLILNEKLLKTYDL